jgi:hypothetical protein
MKEINRGQFETVIKENKKNIVFFRIESCGGCDFYLKEIKHNNIDTSDWYMVTIGMDEISYYLSLGIDKMPVTRIYRNDKVIWEKIGVLFNLQFNNLLTFYRGRE